MRKLGQINNQTEVDKILVGLGNVDNTSDVNKPISTATQIALNNKVDKITGKGLSTNDYTTTEKTKLTGIEAGAEVNTINSVVAGTNITIDKTDPLNPVISSTGMGTGDVTASGTLTNDTIILGNGTTSVKSSSKTIVTTLGSDDTSVPTSKAVKDITDGKVTGNTAITGATKTKITYDAKGLVIAGDDATTADIPDSSNKRYVTDAQLTVIGNTSNTNTGDQDLSGLVPKSTTITINGTTQDLSTNRSWTISGGSGLTAYDGYIAGELTTGTIFETGFASAKTLTKFKCSLKTLPTGADFIIKAYKNGVEDASVTIATTATATNGLYVSDDTTFVSGSYAENDRLTISIVQVGSTLSGTNLSWQII